MHNRAVLRIDKDLILRISASGTSRAVALDPPPLRPFLKWPGGKQWLAPLAPHLLPENFTGRYIEPFLGAGSLFFALQPPRAILADANYNLTEAFRGVKQNPREVIALLKGYRHDRVFFNDLRHRSPRTSHTRAARFIYLNKTAFNGMYRENRKGEFNVPFGSFRNPRICPEGRMLRASYALATAEIHCADFRETLKRARRGDFVFLDPPYITGHTNNGFLKYNAHLFTWSDQQALASLALRLKGRGVCVVTTHADFQPALDLFRGFYNYKIERRTAIAADKTRRTHVGEALLTSLPVAGVDTEIIGG